MHTKYLVKMTKYRILYLLEIKVFQGHFSPQQKVFICKRPEELLRRWDRQAGFSGVRGIWAVVLE